MKTVVLFLLSLVGAGNTNGYTSQEECVERFHDRVQQYHPGYACAIMREGYRFSTPKSYWIIFSKHCYDHGDKLYGICIPPRDVGAWLERKGDGGFRNWRYNSRYFTRNGARITLDLDGEEP